MVGASDIEGGFFSTEAQAEAWEAAYLTAATTKKIIFNGSADGCPTGYGATGKTCAFAWTQANYYKLAGGMDPSRIQGLPQVYLPGQADQGANIDATGAKNIVFAGALTEFAACPTGDVARLLVRSAAAEPGLGGAVPRTVDDHLHAERRGGHRPTRRLLTGPAASLPVLPGRSSSAGQSRAARYGVAGSMPWEAKTSAIARSGARRAAGSCKPSATR